ncbi:MAG TPA: hypothetical protein VE825_17010, partial [Terriglobales bacterium]|nr:hypothetical protein [Terriglobales bacterium]
MSAPVFKRILLKLSGEALAAGQGFGVDPIRVQEIAEELQEVHALGVQIAIVVGGGNFFRGVAQQAMEIKADVIMKATKVDGIYDADPVVVKDAKMFDNISYLDILKKGLKV